MSLAGSASWFAFVTALLYIDPEASGFIGLFAFYVSLFLALLATFMLCGLGMRVILKKHKKEQLIVFRLLAPAMRQSIWLSTIVIISLMLLASKLFTLWSVFALVIGFTLLEAFFLSRTNQRSQTNMSEEPNQSVEHST